MHFCLPVHLNWPDRQMYVSELEQRKKQEVSFRLSGSNSADNRSVYQNSFNYEAKTKKRVILLMITSIKRHELMVTVCQQ